MFRLGKTSCSVIWAQSWPLNIIRIVFLLTPTHTQPLLPMGVFYQFFSVWLSPVTSSLNVDQGCHLWPVVLIFNMVMTSDNVHCTSYVFLCKVMLYTVTIFLMYPSLFDVETIITDALAILAILTLVLTFRWPPFRLLIRWNCLVFVFWQADGKISNDFDGQM